MTQDFKLGFRMFLKYPGLTLAGGLALGMAIGLGAGWYQVWGNILSPTIPLPEGDRLVLVRTQNVLTSQPELRVAQDFLEWRRGLQTLEELGAYRTESRTLIVGSATPLAIRSAEMTPAAFRTARVAPVLGRGLQDADALPGAPAVVVLGYGLWQRSLGGRPDVVGAVVQLGGTQATVIGVMPEGFAYPYNQQAWVPLQLRASYNPLEGEPLSVIGRLAPGVTREQADAELRVLGERAASARPDTHAHLRSRVMPLGGDDMNERALFATRNLPALLVLLVACMNVGTLVYARTAMREGEIAVRSALGASRARIVAQLFVEALLLALVSAAIGLLAADRAIRFGLDLVSARFDAAPFWSIRGLRFTTILYACGLAVASAAMLSVLPALRATRTDLQARLANFGAGHATLRFGRVWTGAMIAQVALTAMGLPAALVAANAVARGVSIRHEFPSTDFVTAGIDLHRSTEDAIDAPAFQRRLTRVYAELERRLMDTPETVAVTFATYVPGASPEGLAQPVEVESTAGGAPAFEAIVLTPAVGPRFFETIGRPILAGRDFQEGDRISSARTVVVNDAFARLVQRNTGQGSPIGARVRRRAGGPGAETAQEPWYEIVGVAQDIGLDPSGDDYEERAFVYFAASPATVGRIVTLIRVRDNAGGFAARLPAMAAAVDPGLTVQHALPLNDIVQLRDRTGLGLVGALGGVTLLVLAMSAMGIFSLMSVSVSRRTREIGLRTALGANRRQVMVSVLSRAAILMTSGGAIGGALLLGIVSVSGTERPADAIAAYVPWLAVTTLVMLATGVLAAMGPARRALRINPTDALRDA